MAILYITKLGAAVRKDGERLQVHFEGELLTSVPLREIERVILLGPIQMSAAMQHTLLKRNIPIIFASSRGRYRGILSPVPENTQLLLQQVSQYHNFDYRLQTSKMILACKIRYQRTILRRRAQTLVEHQLTQAADQIHDLLSGLKNATTIEQSMGFEGQASAVYFGVLGRCFLPPTVEFTHRNRRPPKDPVNSLLSFGYMLLMSEIVGVLTGLGLHVGLGFLHQVAVNRPSLALDLVEIFRQPVVDRLVLRLFNRRILSPSDFVPAEKNGVWLKDEGRGCFLSAYEQALTSHFQHPQRRNKKTTFRQLIRDEASLFRRSISEQQIFSPLSLDL